MRRLLARDSTPLSSARSPYRRGSIISVFASTDGTTFTPNGDVETVELTDLPATVYVGFAGTALTCLLAQDGFQIVPSGNTPAASNAERLESLRFFKPKSGA